MTPKPPRLNVPMLVKRYKIEVFAKPSATRQFGAHIVHNGLPYTAAGPSKRKAVLDVLKQAGIEI